MISLQKIIKAMETQLKTPEKRGEIVDLQISPPEVPPKKRGEIEDVQISSSEVQIEDLSEEKLFLRKKIMQKSTEPVHQIKDQKLSLVKNLLQEICKDENEETGLLQIQILLQMVEKVQKNQPIGKLQEKAESGQDTNIQIAILQKQVKNIEANMAKKMNQILEAISQKKTPTYAEIASKNLPVPQVVITKKQTSQRISQLTSQLTGQT